MRIFALSDVHVDHQINEQWLTSLSAWDYRDDVLILAGDVSDSIVSLERCLSGLLRRFRYLMFVPGNHDLWMTRDKQYGNSLEKFTRVLEVASQCGAVTRVLELGTISIVPLFSWYDYSFGPPSRGLQSVWMDHYACVWPEPADIAIVTDQFLAKNEPRLSTQNDLVISFSHFLPRIDLMPAYIPQARRMLYPVLGTSRLEEQIRRLQPAIHVYGHSHINRFVTLDGITYVNNALGYPHECAITGRKMLCIHGADVT